MKQNPLPLELARAQEYIEKIASDYGLTFFRTVFEMVDYHQMNALAGVLFDLNVELFQLGRQIPVCCAGLHPYLPFPRKSFIA